MSVPAEAPQLQPRSCASCGKSFNVPVTSTATQCADCQLGAAIAAGGRANYENQFDVNLRKRAKGEIVGGLVILGIGVAITAGTYASASANGGSYYITVGPIAVGLGLLIRGLIKMG
jgi:hypothetical protein